MNYFEEIGETESKKFLKFIVKRLLKGYGQELQDADDFKDTINLLYKELMDVKCFSHHDLVSSYKRMMQSYTKYRRFTVAGYLTEFYEARK